MAAIADADVSIDSSGNIRWTGAATTNRHTVLEFIQWLMDKQDDAQAAGDDLLDITVSTPFNRSTDQILTLNAPFNIDDTFALHLYDGSVTQNGGDDVYSGLGVIGPVETGTEYMILQGGKVLPAFWGTGINAEASPSLVFSRHLVKSREGGADIDGQRITVLARELGDQYRRFPVTLGTGNSVAAISNGADIFNTTADTTIAGWTTIVNTENFQELDIDGSGAAGQEYYSQWDTGSQTINDTYERSKWISQRSHIADQTGGSPNGTDRIVDNATIVGQAQSFIPLSGSELLTEARLQLKIGAGTPTGTVYCELYDSDDAGGGGSRPTGSALARSEGVLASHFTSSYEDTIFRFNRFNPSTGADQIDGLILSNAEYFIVVRNDEGDASNYIHVDGSAAGVSADATMNTAEENPAATWTANVADLDLIVKSSPAIHGVPGEVFQGINVEVGFDGESGSGVLETEATNDELAIWGTRLTYNTLSGSFVEGEYIAIYADGTTTNPKSGGQVLYDDGTDMIVALENPAASVIATTDDIIAVSSGATANITTIDATADESFSGGMGYVLAKDDNGTTGEFYLQVVSGVNPVDNNRIFSRAGTTLSDYADATATITSRTINPEFMGTSTGSNIIGAYGIGFVPGDVGSSDLFLDLSNTQRTPPNNVTYTVSGLVAGEDRVLIAPRTGTAINDTQLATDTTLSGATETLIQCSAAIPAGTPSSGTLRVELDSTIHKRIRYESSSGNDYTILAPDTFVDGDVTVGTDQVNIAGHAFVTLDKVQLSNSGGALPTGLSTSTDYWIIRVDANNIQFADSVANAVAGTPVDITAAAGGGTHTITPFESVDGSTTEMRDFTGDNATSAADVFITYIDTLARTTSESYTAVHTSDVDIFVRVRDGGATPIKTFEIDSATFVSTDSTVAAVRTADV